MSHILCCVDSNNFSQEVCDYGILIAQNTKKPLKFLNIIEHDHRAKKLDLSGSIALGAKDDILEELTQSEATTSREAILHGKKLLSSLKERATKQSLQDVSTTQVHGEFIENILEIKEDIKVLVIATSSTEGKSIGENVEEVIRETHKPVLLVNAHFVTPKKILIAYNGSFESKEMLKILAKTPLFGDIQRTIVNINSNPKEAEKLLEEAKEIFAKQNIDVQTQALEGDVTTQLLAFFKTQEFDILAMGAFGHSRLKEFFFGSKTEKIITNLQKPLLLLR